ncbi:MAG: hypothetical protein R6V36_08645 [Psychroflexus sp.]
MTNKITENLKNAVSVFNDYKKNYTPIDFGLFLNYLIYLFSDSSDMPVKKVLEDIKDIHESEGETFHAIVRSLRGKDFEEND